MFCVFAVFSLCPLAGLAARYNLIAGGLSNDTFYTNAPVFIAGDSGRDKDGRTGSTILDNTNGEAGKVTSVNIKPLFKTGGAVERAVLTDLLTMLDDSKVKKDPSGTGDVKYYSAKNFGQYGAQNDWTASQKGNAQILVKLFDTVGDAGSKINNFTSQYWQVVYRSVNGENDVLTLYMARPYIIWQQFNDTNKGGNYSESAVRDVILDDYATLIDKFSKVDPYIVAPYQLSSSDGAEFSTTGYDKSGKNRALKEKTDFLNLGGWQSSAYQTSQSARNLTEPPSINGNWLSSTDTNITSKLGASGYCDEGDTNWGYEYGVNNGLDGLGDGWKSWSSIDTNYADKLWLPSGFEVLHTGYGQTATSQLQNTGRLYDEANDIIYLDSNYSKATAGINSEAYTSSHKNTNRTGLWELSGYDRAIGEPENGAWLRSGATDNCDSVRVAHVDGDNCNFKFSDGIYVRVALHLSLSALKVALSKKIQLNISATNNSVNSLLVLTVMDGDARIADYSCISGTINATLTLELNKTYKILATRPFGSSLEVKLDEVLQSPTNFACYEIQTAENDQMNIIFTLTGDGSCNNCIVV